MIALLLAAVTTMSPAMDLLWNGGCIPGLGLPEGWVVKPVTGTPEPDFEITQSGDGCSLEIEGRGAAAWAHRELDTPLSANAGILSWEWHRIEFPRGADLDARAGDDSPLRVYVVFGRPTLLGPARAIFYSIASKPAPARLSFESNRIAVVPLTAGTLRRGRNVAAVAPFRDYRRFWPGEPPPIQAVGLMQDTDATGQEAAVTLRELSWSPSQEELSTGR